MFFFIPIPNIFYWPLLRWTCEINALDLGNAPSDVSTQMIIQSPSRFVSEGASPFQTLFPRLTCKMQACKTWWFDACHLTARGSAFSSWVRRVFLLWRLHVLPCVCVGKHLFMGLMSSCCPRPNSLMKIWIWFRGFDPQKRKGQRQILLCIMYI